LRFLCVFDEFNFLLSRLLSFSYPCCLLLIISLYGWPYLSLSLRYTLFSLLICSYLCCHVMIVIMMMMMMTTIIIVIIIIGLRNEKRHSRHPYISQPNIRTIKSMKISLGDSFMYGKNKKLRLFDLAILDPRIVKRFQDFWNICGPLE